MLGAKDILGPLASKEQRIRYEGTVEKTQALSSAALTEEIGNASATTAKDGEIDVTNTLAQLGRPLTTQQFIQRVRRLNGNLIFEKSKSDETKMGVYIMAPMRDNSTQSLRRQKQFICGMENGYMPERSVRHWEPDKIPDPDLRGGWKIVKKFTRETRGWRTVLARLVRQRLVTKTQVDKHFPPIGYSFNWQQLTS
jgi:hypothetical protein